MATPPVIFPPLEIPYAYQRFCLTEDSRLMPLMGHRATEVFNDYTRVQLLCGARKSGKTMSGLANRIMRHCWEIDGAVVACIGRTIRNVGGGLWGDLLKFTVPGWCDSGIGMQVTQTERLTSDSHMRYFRVNNLHGSTSEIQLYSLNHEPDVERLFKSLRFSCIVFSEIDQVEKRHTLDILLDQLRMPGVPYEHHLFLCDANPPEDGKDHFLYNCFVNRDESNKQLMPESSYHHFTIDDNIFLNPKERDNLKAKYGYDAVKYKRFVLGQWEKDSSKGHFDAFFSFNVHVIGDTASPNKEEWNVIVPPAGTTTLITGSDIGSVNHAATFMLARATASRDVVFDIFDEVVSIDKPVSLRTFAEMMLERVTYWEDFMKREYGTQRIHWRNWTDSSALGYRASNDSTDAQTIYRATEGKLYLMAAKKGPGSIAQRVNLVKRLLHGNRLFVSANCVNTVDWLRHLRPGNTRGETVARGLDCRHAWDSASYAIAQEIPIEMEIREQPQVAKAEELVMV